MKFSVYRRSLVGIRFFCTCEAAVVNDEQIFLYSDALQQKLVGILSLKLFAFLILTDAKRA